MCVTLKVLAKRDVHRLFPGLDIQDFKIGGVAGLGAHTHWAMGKGASYLEDPCWLHAFAGYHLASNIL